MCDAVYSHHDHVCVNSLHYSPFMAQMSWIYSVSKHLPPLASHRTVLEAQPDNLLTTGQKTRIEEDSLFRTSVHHA